MTGAKRKQKQRICYIETARAVGGSSLSLLELVRGLDAQRYEPVVLFYHHTPAVQQFRDSGIQVLTLGQAAVASPVELTTTATLATTAATRDIEGSLNCYGHWLGVAYRYSKEAYWLARRDWPIARHVARFLEQEAIDLVHHNNSLRGNQSAILGARWVGLPQICHVRMLHPYSALTPFSHRLVAAFIYISKAVEQCYRAWGVPPSRGRIIHNPISLTAFAKQASDDRRTLRTELGLTPADKVISNVGRLSWWKGQDYFIQAMAAVVQSEPQAKALIVGEPSTASPKEVAYYERLQQLVHGLQLSNHVTFTGFRTDIPRIMAASDVVVHSASEPEPFGRVIVEAMLAGRPLVATAAGGVLEIVEDGATGLLAPPKDASAMAKAITYLLQNWAAATRMGACARQRAAARFTVEQHVRQVEQVYEEVLR